MDDATSILLLDADESSIVSVDTLESVGMFEIWYGICRTLCFNLISTIAGAVRAAKSEINSAAY